MSKNPAYPPCPPDFESRILEAAARPSPPAVEQFLEELYPTYDFAAVTHWNNARWRLFAKHVDAINSRRESEGQPLLPRLPGQRPRRRGRVKKKSSDDCGLIDSHNGHPAKYKAQMLKQLGEIFGDDLKRMPAPAIRELLERTLKLSDILSDDLNTMPAREIRQLLDVV